MTSDALVVYEDLPEGVEVMLGQRNGRDVIVIDEKLSRVERHRAHAAGKAKLKALRGQKILMPLALLTEWGTKVKELAPSVRGPATTLAGGAMAMSLAVASPSWPGEDPRRPDLRLALPTPTSETRTPTAEVTVSPVRHDPAPSAKSSTRPPRIVAPVVDDAEPVQPSPAPTPTSDERPEPQEPETESEPSAVEAETPTRKARPRPRKDTSAAPAGEQDAPAKSASDLPKATVPPVVDVDTPAPAPEAPKVKKPRLDVPLVDTGNCDGVVNVDVKLLPKVCVG
ncbi:hypothetical protein [Nonomuraea sp. NPDC023979]|uniref:hypothetical protein n=1 Tax=Nonomuraea sp. NPDC023979 TaxID=3154796 RepID=UPI0033CE3A27